MNRERTVTVALAVALALLAVTAMPVGAIQTNTASIGQSTESDFDAGTVSGSAEVLGSGESANVTIQTNETQWANFSHTGSLQQWTVPEGITSATVRLHGAGTGTAGGYVEGDLAVVPGDTLYLYVGGSNTGASGGWPNGGDGADIGITPNAQSEGGAGYTAVRNGSDTVAATVAVAGGAGGDGDAVADSGFDSAGGGGAGGADTGAAGGDATADTASAGGGGGGTQDNGGGGGTASGNDVATGGSGSQLAGGNGGADTDESDNSVAGGGGGAGWYGGGGGGAAHTTEGDSAAGGGGGGSNYDDGLSSVAANTRGGGNTGDGSINISYQTPDTGTFVSSNITVQQSTQGWVNVTTATNANMTVTFEGWDGSQWTTLNQTTDVTTVANHTFTWSESSTTKVRVNVTSQAVSGTDSTLTFADWGAQFTNEEPRVLNTTASPTGELTSASPTLEIDVNDTTFPLSQGDSVEVQFSVDGSPVGTDTLTSNGTASTSATFTGGDHTWSVSATDSYGLTNTSQTFDVTVPGNLTIREEAPPHNPITSCSAEVLFFEETDDNPTIVNQTDSDGDGNISLEGLPAGSEFVATIDCDGYHSRTVLIDSIFDQQSAFLLSTSQGSVEVTFQVDDQTGDFGDDTQVAVQKAINRSLYDAEADGFSWTNIGGDTVGASNSFTIDLETDDRYRLRVDNDAGVTRILGTHTATTSQVVTLTIQDVTITIQNVTADVLVGFEKDTENNDVEFLYNDTTDSTTDLEVIIYERGNRFNELHNQTHAGPFGELLVEPSVSEDQANVSWVVEFSGTRNGETIDGQLLTGDRGDLGLPIAQWVLEFGSVFAIILMPTLLGGERAVTGAMLAVIVAGVAWWLQFLPGSISILSILLAGMLAVGFKMRERGRGNIT